MFPRAHIAHALVSLLENRCWVWWLVAEGVTKGSSVRMSHSGIEAKMRETA